MTGNQLNFAVDIVFTSAFGFDQETIWAFALNPSGVHNGWTADGTLTMTVSAPSWLYPGRIPPPSGGSPSGGLGWSLPSIRRASRIDPSLNQVNTTIDRNTAGSIPGAAVNGNTVVFTVSTANINNVTINDFDYVVFNADGNISAGGITANTAAVALVSNSDIDITSAINANGTSGTAGGNGQVNPNNTAGDIGGAPGNGGNGGSGAAGTGGLGGPGQGGSGINVTALGSFGKGDPNSPGGPVAHFESHLSRRTLRGRC